MIYYFIFFTELAVLYLMSQKVQIKFGKFLYKTVSNKNLAIYIMSVIYLPGTFIHEIAHFLFALLLFVPVGELELIPKIHENGIKLGSVSFVKTDPIRRFLIGIAPLLMGLMVILLSVYFIVNNELIYDWWVYLIIGYFVFTVANTMFMSSKDMEESWVFFGLLAFSIILVIILGINVNFDFLYFKPLLILLERVCYFLLIPLILDIIALFLMQKI